MNRVIYADNAATTRLDTDAFEAMRLYLLEQYANPSQPYSFARQAKKALQDSRKMIADCINVEPEEIYFTSGGTESDNWAIKGSVESGDCRTVITSEFEHHAVLRACKKIETLGCPVVYLHPNKDGFITPDNLEAAITDKTKLVSVMTVNNEIGTIQPIKELCDIAHKHGAVFHTDAVQALGHIPVDVKELGVDMMSCSAHKFNGPKGIGFLFVKKGTRLSSYADGGAQEFGLRAGTENVAGIVGMAAALRKNTACLNDFQSRLLTVEQTLIDKLDSAGISYRRNGAMPRVPGSLSLSFPGTDGEAVLHRLDLMGIMVSTGSACDSRNTQISHVLAAINADELYARGTIRISLGKDNTVNDAEKIAEAIIRIVSH
ncbi:MAG: cysteine desulfurase [Clostridiales bacterium]|nr:cysteine desulfurase [Clostridiales bacterium]